jgi:hypothetical protein
MFVYHATYEIKWEAPRDLGLFRYKSDAKKACQDEEKGTRLVWNNSDQVGATSQFVYSDEFYMVTRRTVR